MCAVSMVMDHYYDKWYPQVPQPITAPNTTSQYIWIQPAQITKEEIEEFRLLLDRAREYDRKMNQPDCELEEKRKKVKDLAEKLGVEIDFL